MKLFRVLFLKFPSNGIREKLFCEHENIYPQFHSWEAQLFHGHWRVGLPTSIHGKGGLVQPVEFILKWQADLKIARDNGGPTEENTRCGNNIIINNNIKTNNYV